MSISWQSTRAGYVPVEGLVGADIRRLPFLSGFGCLTRLLRLNCCKRNELFMATGMRNDQRRTLLRSTMGDSATQRTLIKTLAITPEIAKHWNEVAWCPATVDWNWRELDWRLRICPSCALVGYHCVLYQMPWITTCPWHGDRLITRCKQCQRPLASTLEGERELLRCECGHDAFSRSHALDVPSSFPSHDAARWLGVYLSWCADNATRCSVVTTSAPVEVSLCGFGALVQMPSPLQLHDGTPRPCWPVHIDYFHGWAREDGAADLRPWMEMLKRGIVMLASLPGGLHKPLQQIGIALSTELKRRVLSGAEKRTASSPAVPLVDKLKPWPVPASDRAQNGSTWVHLTTVLPEALELCTKVIGEIDTTRALGPQSPALWLAKIDAHHRWKSILLAVLQTLIRRGYAWGLRFVMAKQFTTMHSDARIAPQRRVPVLVLTHASSGIIEAAIAWVRPTTVHRLSDELLSRASAAPSVRMPVRRVSRMMRLSRFSAESATRLGLD